MPSICIARPSRARRRTPHRDLSLGPFIAPPLPPCAHKIPPMPPPDVLDPGLDDEELDLPLEEDDPEFRDEPELPEEGPDGARPQEDIRRPPDAAEDEEQAPTLPEKQRRPDVDVPLPEPETRPRHRPYLH